MESMNAGAKKLRAAQRALERHGDLLQQIFRRVNELHDDEGHAKGQGLFEQVANELGVRSGSTCRDLYYKYTNLQNTGAEPSRPVAAPAGRQMLLLHKWGASPEAARDLIRQVYSAAGDRVPYVDELFSRMERTRPEWHGARRIEWLRLQAKKMADNPVYFPATRPPWPRARHSELIINALRNMPGNEATYAQLLQATGILSLHSLRVSTSALVRAGRLVRTKYGRFALPSARAGKNLWRSIRGEVLTVLTGMPGNKAPVSELTRIINRARGAGSSVSSAISRLVHEGRVKRLNREMVALTEAAIGQKSWEPQGQHRAIQKVVEEILRQNRRVATAELRKRTSASKNGVNYVVRKLVRENKLRRVWPGVYASPHTGQKSWSPARDAILDAFRGRDRVARAKLIEITGRKGPAIAAAIHDLVREGKLKRVQRGVYTVVKAA